MGHEQRKVKRRKVRRKNNKTPTSFNIQLTPIQEQYPPSTSEMILIYERDFGFDIRKAHVVLDHIHDDANIQCKKPLVTHWGRLAAP